MPPPLSSQPVCTATVRGRHPLDHSPYLQVLHNELLACRHALGLAWLSSQAVADPRRPVITIPLARTLGRPMSGRTDITRFRVRRDSIAAVRRHVRSTLIDWKLGGLIEDAVLISSELTANAVSHAKGTGDYFELALRRRGGVLVLEVSDSYQWRMPELRTPASDDPSGRGLLVVDALSQRWGVRPRRRGKTVWAHMPIGRTGEAR
ncbi:ATP-binding protein [Streptomyces sp. NPDC001339]|uniref:ATP-binding protein n=1 Tax=Streptomyces sp. NPDC001339 TaxID=3364563 RepID=UPI0036BC35DB